MYCRTAGTAHLLPQLGLRSGLPRPALMAVPTMASGLMQVTQLKDSELVLFVSTLPG